MREEYDTMEDIVKLKAQGQNFTAIAKALGIKRAEAIALYDQWNVVATSDPVVRQMGRDAVAEMNEHFNVLLVEQHDVIEEAKMIDGHEGLKIRNTALKNSAEISAKRVDFLQRAGLIEDAAMAEQLAQMDEKAQAIKELLQNVAREYPQTREMITTGLGRIFNQPTGVVVVQPGD